MTLRFEENRWKYTGARDAAIRHLFSESPTRYYQRLGTLLDRREALEAYPATVHRLRRLRDLRRRQRAGR